MLQLCFITMFIVSPSCDHFVIKKHGVLCISYDRCTLETCACISLVEINNWRQGLRELFEGKGLGWVGAVHALRLGAQWPGVRAV